MKTIAVDIDGVLATKLESGNYPADYVKKLPIGGGLISLRYLKKEGYYIKLFTARRESDREVTVDWLKRYGFEGLYDELIMDKPHYDLLIDDRALRFQSWQDTLGKVKKLKDKEEWF